MFITFIMTLQVIFVTFVSAYNKQNPILSYITLISAFIILSTYRLGYKLCFMLLNNMEAAPKGKLQKRYSASQFTLEHPCRNVTSIKFICNHFQNTFFREYLLDTASFNIF